MSFSKRLKDARIKSGLKQKDIADKLGISQQSYAQYETGKRKPKKETLSKIANALNLGYSYTKDGEPYFYSFIDTVSNPEHSENESFNNMQYEDAKRIIEPYIKLNDAGQEKAIEQVELLTKIPDYQKKDE